MNRVFKRALRAASFDRKPFREAFFDDNATADAAILVALVAAGGYVGSLLWHGVIGRFSLTTLFQILLGSVMSWLILAVATWFVATRLFGASGRPQTMMGLHGLTVLPLLLEIPGRLVASAALVWYLVLLVMATREASDLKTRDAGVSVLIGFGLAALVRMLFQVPFALFS